MTTISEDGPLGSDVMRRLGDVERGFFSSRIWLYLVYGALAFCFLELLSDILGRAYWRHDSLQYLYSYDSKLATEGRWVNWLFFNQLRRMDPVAAWLLGFACHSVFAYVAARRIVGENGAIPLHWLAAGAIALQAFSPSLHAQMNWPLVTVPANLILLAAALSSFYLPRWLFFIIFSILFGGSIQSFHYLLPFLALPSGKAFAEMDARSRLLEVVYIFALWAGGFVLAFASFQVLTILFTGEVMQAASWRGPAESSGLSSIISNFTVNMGRLHDHVRLLFPTWMTIAAIGVLGAAAMVLFRRDALKSFWPYLLFAVAALFSHYVITSVNGINVQARTCTHFYPAAFVVFVAMAASVRSPALFALLTSLAVIPAIDITRANIRWYADISNFVSQSVEYALPRPGPSFKGAVLDARSADSFNSAASAAGRIDPRKRVFESMTGGNLTRYRPAFYELGVRPVILCPPPWGDPPQCKQLAPPAADGRGDCANPDGLICDLGIDENGMWRVRLNTTGATD